MSETEKASDGNYTVHKTEYSHTPVVRVSPNFIETMHRDGLLEKTFGGMDFGFGSSTSPSDDSGPSFGGGDFSGGGSSDFSSSDSGSSSSDW